MSITVMEQTTDALDEILESFEKDGKFCKSSVIRNELFDKLKTTLEQSKQAIAEAEQEPVALKVVKGEICYKSNEDDQSFGMWCPVTPQSDLHFAEGTRFYTSPPQRQPLTDEQMFEFAEIAWRHGWASCRDAEYVGEEAEDERWGMVGAEVVQDIAAHGITASEAEDSAKGEA